MERSSGNRSPDHADREEDRSWIELEIQVVVSSRDRRWSKINVFSLFLDYKFSILL